uniref:Uncharacterized protein n=1 Tax=Parascaris univalens TaxID=6257 RepID=A0A915A344_PARUN
MFEVDWSFGNAYVSLYNERYPCASQRVASTKNRKGLLVVHVVRKDTLKPYIGKATMLADGGQAAFKVLLKYIEKPNGSDSHVLFIAAMAGTLPQFFSQQRRICYRFFILRIVLVSSKHKSNKNIAVCLVTFICIMVASGKYLVIRMKFS